MVGWLTVAGSLAAQFTPTASARARMKRMTVRDQVAQLVMPWLLGDYVGFDANGLAQARAWIDSLHIGGIIISIGAPVDVAAKLNFLQGRSRLPLLIAADLEGGAAFRFAGATPFPTNMGIAATGREQDAYEMGRITGLEGRALGVHLNFAPVADINNNPANPIINTRSFGGNPEAVGRLVAAAIRGTKSTGMLATAKHFPGHGDTDIDSHIALPVVRADWSRLSSVELVPFRAAIRAGVDAIMSAHLAFPGFDGDSTRPATLARAVLTGVLRDSLGFKGLTVTDALDMGALVAAYGGGEATVRAFEAGTDLLLMPTSPRDAIDAMTAAVGSGRISRRRLAESVLKVLTIKERLGLFQRRTVSLDRVGTIVARGAFMDTARAITARSLVLVRDSGGAVARIRESTGDVALVTYGDPSWDTALPRLLTRRGHRVLNFRLYPTSGPASYDSARTMLAGAESAVFSVAVRVASGAGTIAMPAALGDVIESTSRVQSTTLVSFGSPYLLGQAPSPGGYLLAWTASPTTEAAVANALSGAPVGGRLPIDLPPFHRIGDGLKLPATIRFTANATR